MKKRGLKVKHDMMRESLVITFHWSFSSVCCSYRFQRGTYCCLTVVVEDVVDLLIVGILAFGDDGRRIAGVFTLPRR